MPALSPQSILDGRNPHRAPVALIVGLVVSGVCLLLALVLYLLQGGPLNVAVGTLLALPTGVVLSGVLLLIDRLEPEPQLNLWVALGWGAGVAILGALVVNTTFGILAVPLLGSAGAEVFTSILLAPVVEESFKGALLLYLLWIRRHEIDGPTDGIVYAGMCGLGFALVENIMYYMQGLQASGGELAMTVLVRGVLAPLGHPMYTAMIGLGVAYAATHRGFGGIVAVVGGWCGAVFLHALWNGSLTLFAYPGMVLAYLVLALVLVALIVVVVVDRQRIVKLIGRYLPPYIPSGLVQPDDVRMLSSMSGRRQARRWARVQAGVNGARAMSDYQLAATELALLHEHASKTTITPDAFYARRDAILGLMRVARDGFFRRVPQAGPPPWTPRHQQSGFFRPPTQLQYGQLPMHQRPTGPPAPLAGHPGPPSGQPGPPSGQPGKAQPAARPGQQPPTPERHPGASGPGPMPPPDQRSAPGGSIPRGGTSGPNGPSQSPPPGDRPRG